MNNTLIVPMINVSKKYENILPIEFQYNNEDGEMNCLKSINAIDLSAYSKIYFVILYKHEQKYNITRKIKSEIENNEKFTGKTCLFSYLEYPTTSQAQTVYNTIKKYNIKGHIFIKDTDNMYEYDSPVNGNSVMVYSMENLDIIDPKHKSYISTDEKFIMTNVIEKRIISNLFNCGGYSFEKAEDFCEAYERLLGFEDISNHMYISHIIYWLMLNKKIMFTPIETNNYKDFEIE